MTERRRRPSSKSRSDGAPPCCRCFGLTNDPADHEALQSRHDVAPQLFGPRPLDVGLGRQHRRVVEDLLHVHDVAARGLVVLGGHAAAQEHRGEVRQQRARAFGRGPVPDGDALVGAGDEASDAVGDGAQCDRRDAERLFAPEQEKALPITQR